MIDTPGSLLKQARINKGLSMDYISERLKISKEKILAIENNNFISFSSDVFIVGMLRRLSKIVNAQSDYVIQLYNRDFKKDKTSVIPSRRSKNAELLEERAEDGNINSYKTKLISLILNRRSLIFIFVIVVLFLFGCTIIRFVNTALKAPELKIVSPVELYSGQEVVYSTEENSIIIKGETEKNTVVKINNIPVQIKTGFNFESDPLPITSNENIINIEATNNLGIKSQAKLVVQRIFKKLELNLGN